MDRDKKRTAGKKKRGKGLPPGIYKIHFAGMWGHGLVLRVARGVADATGHAVEITPYSQWENIWTVEPEDCSKHHRRIIPGHVEERRGRRDRG